MRLDFAVDDIDRAVDPAVAAGARLEVPARRRPFGRIAVLSRPFGHGFCLLESEGGP